MHSDCDPVKSELHNSTRPTPGGGSCGLETLERKPQAKPHQYPQGSFPVNGSTVAEGLDGHFLKQPTLIQPAIELQLPQRFTIYSTVGHFEFQL